MRYSFDYEEKSMSLKMLSHNNSEVEYLQAIYHEHKGLYLTYSQITKSIPSILK